MPSRNYRF